MTKTRRGLGHLNHRVPAVFFLRKENKMKLYIYDYTTNYLVAIVEGENEADCESKAKYFIGRDDNLGTTYAIPHPTGECGQIIDRADVPVILIV